MQVSCGLFPTAYCNVCPVLEFRSVQCTTDRTAKYVQIGRYVRMQVRMQVLVGTQHLVLVTKYATHVPNIDTYCQCACNNFSVFEKQMKSL